MDKNLGIRSDEVFSLTGFFSFNRQDLRGDGDGYLLSKELIRVVWLLGLNRRWLWNADVDGWKIKLWIQGLGLMEGIIKTVVVWDSEFWLKGIGAMIL